MRSTQITESPRCRSTAETTLLFVWNACTHCQGPPCVEKLLSVDCRGDPVICVECTHALPGTALCREIVVGRLQRRPCYLCGTHARIARGYPVQRNCCRSTAEVTLLFVWNARTHCQGLPCVEKLLSQRRPCYLCGTHARTQCQGPPCVKLSDIQHFAISMKFDKIRRNRRNLTKSTKFDEIDEI